ncbi:WD40 repeat domain-containing protein [Streptomyces sp. WAC06614]|uniref:WD40 repeat domain-containing protein n=1 Tax=Streptomyces sp. WAC06614 TaxID=2487416 RepID=UPI00163BC6EB|nr:WD40 repeat domain-containing protein [Streptomyces sp. WAC06614]
MASRHEGGDVVVWDLRTEVPAHVIGVGTDLGTSLAFSSDGHWLAVPAGDHVHVYDADGHLARDLTVPPCPPPGTPRSGGSAALTGPGGLGPLAFAPGDRHLVIACLDGVLRKLDVHGRLVGTWPHRAPVSDLAVAQDVLVTGCLDGRVRVWSWDEEMLRRTPYGPLPDHLALSADASTVAVADEEGVITLWEHEAHRLSDPATAAGQSPAGVAFLGRDRGLVTGTHDGVVERWALPGRVAARKGAA